MGRGGDQRGAAALPPPQPGCVFCSLLHADDPRLLYKVLVC
jgi:hypothetical protein